MAAKPVMTKDQLKTILQMFVVAGHKPDSAMMACFAKATGQTKDYVEITYGDVYAQVEVDGGDPNAPPPIMIG